MFDQDGLPISVAAQPCPESGRAVGVAARDHRGDQRWNVFPLREKVVADPVNYPCDLMAGPTTEPVEPAPPMVVVPPLTEPSPEPSVSPTEGP